MPKRAVRRVTRRAAARPTAPQREAAAPKPAATVSAPAPKRIAAKGATRAKARRGAGAPRGSTDYRIKIAAVEKEISFQPSRALARTAQRWVYRLRNRLRWKDRESAQETLAADCLKALLEIGADEAKLRSIADSPLLEVSIPWRNESFAWDARIFPWEFMLTEATRALGRSVKVTVVRQLEAPRSRVAPDALLGKRKARVLFVESAPGALRDAYEFDSEFEMVRTALDRPQVKLVRDPTRRTLAEAVQSFAPDLVHLAGFDTHQAFDLLTDLDPASVPKRHEESERATAFRLDGYVLTENRRPDPIGGEELGEILNLAKSPLRFVGCNFYDSALRFAPMLVANGAGGAIGFRDLEDDALMEMFFARFYRGWASGEGGVLGGFSAGWDALRGQPRDVRGTSIALWGGTSILPKQAASRRVVEQIQQAEDADIAIPAGRLDRITSVDVEPVDEINYSLLHNGGSAFEQFLIHKFVPGRMTGVSVDVELQVGTESIKHRSTLTVQTNPADLSDQIHFPLAWTLSHQLHEAVRSTIFVEVAWQGRLLLRDTYPVTLMPMSLWADTPTEDPLLPSFVFPRDPAVLRIVSAAQKYLSVLADDPSAGFDGYQSVEDDDGGSATDNRAKAIWYALIQDYPVHYSDPPPSGGVESQRLRSPSEILNGERGTCIDLALLLAACFEYIDLYPVLFILDDHVFVGYWRTEDDHDEFEDRPLEQSAPGRSDERGQAYPWALGTGNLKEVLALIKAEKIIALDAIDLGWRNDFETARKEGGDYFDSAEEMKKFAFMLDVGIARNNQVTPLPFPEDSILEARR